MCSIKLDAHLLRDWRLVDEEEDDGGGPVDEAAATAPEEGLPRGGGAADLKRSEIHILVKWT